MMLQTIPVISVTNMQASLQFYIDGLDFELASVWLNDGKIKWCSIENGAASIELEEISKTPDKKSRLRQNNNTGYAICFLCDDVSTVYTKLLSKAIAVQEPVINNHKWIISLHDPDGCTIRFSSETEQAEAF